MTSLSLVQRIIRFGLAGVLATAIYFAAVVILVEAAGLAPVVAAVIATLIVIGTSYVINRAFVFETNRAHASAFLRFAIASLLGISMNALLMYLATRVLAWPYQVGAALTIAVVPPLNFVVNQFWTFRPTVD